ncbi:MAG: cytochrome P450 [Chloroflexi bacterium]|nr:cytochrome P450 [Chloroflexota bacterium]
MTATNDPAAAKPVPTGIQLMPLDPAFREDPHPILDELREREPVHYNALMGTHVLTRHEDVTAVLHNRELSVDPRKSKNESVAGRMRAQRLAETDAEPSMLFQDPPHHDRLRGLVNKAFTPRAVDAMGPRIRAITSELLDGLEGRDGFDVIADFSAPLPTIVIAEMLGVDPKDQKQFKKWSDIGIQGFNPFLSDEKRAEVEKAGREQNAYLVKAVAERRKDRRHDLLTAMIEAEEHGQMLSDEEVVTMTSLLLAAGNLTTTDLIGNGVLALLDNPAELEKLRNDPSLIVNAVEEMIRYDPPVVQSGRTTLTDMEIRGCPVQAGQSIGVSLAAANHDPSVHPNPHHFDVTREEINHVSFGGGRRYCLGAPLARLEAQTAILALIQRFPKLRLDPSAKIEHRQIPAFRGLVELRVLVS